MKKSVVNSFIFIFLSFLILIPLTATAQDEWEDTGEIEDAKIVIEKDKKLELARADRNYEKIPPLPVKTSGEQRIVYNFNNFHFNPGIIEPKIRVFTLKEDPLNRLYGNFVKAGFGNYLTPYLEAYSYNKRNEEYSFGAHFRHLSSIHGPVDQRNSGNSDNMLALSGKYFTEPLVFNGKVKYQREKYYFYGYHPEVEVDRDTIKQIFNNFNISAGLTDNFEDALVSFSLNTGFNYLADRFNARETQFVSDLDLSYQISDELSALIDADVLLSNRKDSGSLNRNLFKLKPSFIYDLKPLKIQAGFNVAFHNDTLSNSSQMNFYPFVNAEYWLTDQINVYAGIEGDLIANTLQKIVDENPFVGPDFVLQHTNKTLEFSGGIKGSLLQSISFNTGFSLGEYKNMYFYANSERDTTKFALLYDTDGTTLFNFFGELGFQKSDNLMLNFRGDVYAYNTSDVAEAWHRPGFQLTFSGNYTLYDKIRFGTDLYFIGGLQGYMLHREQGFDMEDIVDLNFQIDYLFSDRFNAFISIDNMLNQKYERYLNYPSRRMLVMAGISYSF